LVWRNGHTDIQPTIYITTYVNYEDRPGGCKAITAVRKTAQLYEDVFHEAACFICNRMMSCLKMMTQRSQEVSVKVWMLSWRKETSSSMEVLCPETLLMT
jgi:hypothetical protein